DDDRKDVDLLSRYVATHDEAAFATLMVRHSSLVWNVCKSISSNTQDIEEAYQATFLALAQKAGKIRATDSLGGWLCQVAHRTALKVRKSLQSQQRLHERLKSRGSPEAAAEPSMNDLNEILHDEIAKLPDKLRVAVVLHYFEGKTLLETAEIMG